MRDRLYRSRKDRVISGVCGGIAEYFDIDPVIIRILFVILGPATGFGLVAYIIMWIVVPEESIEHYYARFTQNPNPFASSNPNPAPEPGVSQEPGAEPTQAKATPNFSPEMMNEYYPPKKSGTGSFVFGIVLIVIGILFLFWTIIPSFDLELFFPIVIVVVGASLIINSIKK